MVQLSTTPEQGPELRRGARGQSKSEWESGQGELEVTEGPGDEWHDWVAECCKNRPRAPPCHPVLSLSCLSLGRDLVISTVSPQDDLPGHEKRATQCPQLREGRWP